MLSDTALHYQPCYAATCYATPFIVTLRYIDITPCQQDYITIRHVYDIYYTLRQIMLLRVTLVATLLDDEPDYH